MTSHLTYTYSIIEFNIDRDYSLFHCDNAKDYNSIYALFITIFANTYY